MRRALLKFLLKVGKIYDRMSLNKVKIITEVKNENT